MEREVKKLVEITLKYDLTEEDVCAAIADWLDKHTSDGSFEIKPDDLDWQTGIGGVLIGVAYTRVETESEDI